MLTVSWRKLACHYQQFRTSLTHGNWKQFVYVAPMPPVESQHVMRGKIK